jgi:2-amino-4-hydroxy-6-hydroxymethyldihydropteridine diphosphokinase
MAIVYLGLGSNLGVRAANIAAAARKLEAQGVRVRKSSALTETEPYGVTEQPSFVNCVLECETELSPSKLIATTLRVEKELGRVRKKRWGPRSIDIDVLFYDDRIIDIKNLKVPHYDMQNREFVLAPLCELNPGLVHPALGVTVSELLSRLKSRAKPRQDK